MAPTVDPNADTKFEVEMKEEVEKHADSITSKSADEETGKANFTYSPEEKKLVKKLSWSLMPLVWCIIFVQVSRNGKKDGLWVMSNPCLQVCRQIYAFCSRGNRFASRRWHECITVQLGLLNCLSRLLGLPK